MNKKNSFLLLSCLMASCLLSSCDKKIENNNSGNSNFISSSIVEESNSSSSDIVEEEKYYEGYYQDIAKKLMGNQLRSSLYDLMIKTHTYYTSYSGLSSVYPKTDKDLNKNGNILLCYTNTSRAFNGSFSGSINREHVWPDSKGVGKSGPGSDAHHLRPCDLSLNSSRGNLDFDEVSNGRYASENGITTQNKVGSNAFEPQDSTKGAIARIIFYVGMHYGPDSSYNLTIVDTIGNGKGKSIGKLSTLLKWNLEHPVDEIEQNRNQEVEKIQGNRNPFIDHPEFACKIWGDYNEATRAICK